MDNIAIEVRGLHKTFGSAPALRDVSLRVRRGEMVALLGASGSGKSTLLRHLNGLHQADAGTESGIQVLGRQVQRDGRIARDIRATRSRVAVVFQQFNLVERLPVMFNVMAGALHRLPLWRGLLRRFPAAEIARAHEAMARVDIARLAWQRASTLSGGQQQRAALSRALVQGAEIILADEPIASLDPEASRKVMQSLADVNRDLGVTVLVSLHQVDFAFAFCPRTIALHEGRIVFDGPTRALTPARLRELYGAQIDELLPTRATSGPEPLPLPEPAFAVVAATSALWFSGAQAQTREVNFGFISTESAANLKSAWQPLLEDLQKSTGLKVNSFFATDYAGVIEAMRFNKIQVAWMGNKSAMEAVDRSNGEIFAKIVAKDGSEGYKSLIITNRDG